MTISKDVFLPIITLPLLMLDRRIALFGEVGKGAVRKVLTEASDETLGHAVLGR